MDPLIEWMTGVETLLFYGRLKGLPKEGLPDVVDRLIARVRGSVADGSSAELPDLSGFVFHKVGLTKFAKKVCGSYSGEWRCFWTKPA